MVLKFIFDRFFSLILLVILSPVLLVVFILHKIKMPKGRFLFMQVRIGKAGKPFKIFKIRTMSDNSEAGQIIN